MPTDGSISSYSTSVPLQAAYFTFAGATGQNVGVGLTGLTLSPNSRNASLTVYLLSILVCRWLGSLAY